MSCYYIFTVSPQVHAIKLYTAILLTFFFTIKAEVQFVQYVVES